MATQNNAWVVIIVVLIVTFLISFNPAEETDTMHDGLGHIFKEFHKNNSERNITRYLPDAELIFKENLTNTTLELRYYYSEEADTTVVACERESTLAICPGIVESLEKDHIGKCMMHNSIAYRIGLDRN